MTGKVFHGLWRTLDSLSSRPAGAASVAASSKVYEDRLDEAMDRYDTSVEARLRQWMVDEGVTSVTDYGTYTPEYIYKQWNGEVSGNSYGTFSGRELKEVEA